ncbi:hypothetical protein [Aquamicrobium sp.]|uniref:hypothetical protein n=1 Tax=Aquamicrobium sp. TaxID=1872579 RepID=UPI002588FA94|nr:hypothetical protein [Aquamicrobium sp.]MCK9553203.1 hypothetical protein [Aquamicrobium sp.]
MKKFKVPFQSQETVWMNNEAIVEAKSKEDAYNKVKAWIEKNSNPFSNPDFDCTQLEMSESMEVETYDINPDEEPLEEFLERVTMIQDTSSYLKADITPYNRAQLQSKNIVSVLKINIADIKEEVKALLEGNVDLTGYDNFWFFYLGTIKQLLDKDWYDEDEIPSDAALLGLQSIANLMTENNAAMLYLIS